jgi:uncharacterized protein YecE (DUF72 family)
VIRVGTSGWVYKHWKDAYYPPKLPAARWFSYYAAEFRTVEINNSFYRLPLPETFRKWRDQAPPGFLYAVKGNRFITHIKKLKDPKEPLRRFLTAARELGPALGPILFQLPPSWRLDLERLRAFIGHLPDDLRFVFEFRDPSWIHDDVRRLLDETGMGYCMHDMKGHPWPDWVTGPLAYVRFHGPSEKKYAGDYPTSTLRRWAERLARIDRDVYAYFNNDVDGHALKNARELIAALD